jgi:low affinity Fe/Cu permease
MILHTIILAVTIGLFIGTLYVKGKKYMDWVKVKLNINGVIKASWKKKDHEEYYTLTGTQIDLEENHVVFVEECEKSNYENDIPPMKE